MELSKFVKLSMSKMRTYVQDNIISTIYSGQLIEDQFAPAWYEEKERWCYESQPEKILEKHSHYYLYTDERNFAIEEDDCDWEVVPALADIAYDNESKRHDKYKLCLRKKSKYGEVLYINIVCDAKNAYSKTFSININAGSGKTYYGRNDGDEHYPIVYIQPQYLSNCLMGLPIKYEEKDEYSSHNYDKAYKDWLKTVQATHIAFNKEHHVDPSAHYVYYPIIPNIRSYSTSKFVIDTYAKEVEQFAKNVREHADWFDTNYKKTYEDLTLKLHKDSHNCNKNLAPDYVSFMSIKYMYPNVTWEDYVNLDKLETNGTEIVDAFLKKCKVSRIESPYDMQADCPYIHTILPDWNPNAINFSKLLPIFKHLDEYRQIVGNASNYKKRVKETIDAYTAERVDISNRYNAEVHALYEQVAHALDDIRSKYSAEIDKLNNQTIDNNKDINVKDLALWHLDIDDNVRKCKAELNECIGNLGTTYDAEIENYSVSDKTYDAQCKIIQIARQIFDIVGDLHDTIKLSTIHKCYDAPHEVYYGNIFEDNEDLYADICETAGESTADELFNNLEALTSEAEYDLDESDGNGLYPGQSLSVIINAELKISEETVY